MTLNEINPFLRYVRDARFNPMPRHVCAYDHHFYYVAGGKSLLEIAGADYALAPGTLVVIPPAVEYLFKNPDALNIIDLNFDYTQNHNTITEGITPAFANVFDRSKAIGILQFDDCPFLNRPLVLHNMHFLRRELTEIVNEHLYKKRFYRETASCIFKNVIIQIARHKSWPDKKSDATVGLILDYIQTHYSEPLDNQKLSRLVGYHPYYVNRLMKLHTGTTLRQYLIHCRLEVAKNCLKETDLPVAAIAERCGYVNCSHFSANFKSQTGMSPAAYRAKTQKLL